MTCKSYKREVAAGCLVAVAAGAAGLYAIDDVEKIKALVPLVTGLGSTVVFMALGVFGLHHVMPPKPGAG